MVGVGPHHCGSTPPLTIFITVYTVTPWGASNRKGEKAIRNVMCIVPIYHYYTVLRPYGFSVRSASVKLVIVGLSIGWTLRWVIE